MSARLATGASIDIAKIEGNARYKAYMRGPQDESNASLTFAKYCPLTQHLCQRYWPFRGVNLSRNPLAPILHASVAAAESALQTSISSVHVAVSVFDLRTIDHVLARCDVLSALEAIRVDGWDRLEIVEREVNYGVDVRRHCSYPHIPPDPPGSYEDFTRLLWTSEYARRSWIADLWEEDCGVVSQLDGVHEDDLGHDTRETCRTMDGIAVDCRGIFMAATGELFGSKKSKNTINRTISTMLTMREHADNDDMRVMPCEGVDLPFGPDEAIDLDTVRSFAPEAAYVGSRAMAWAELGARAKMCSIEDRLAAGREL